MKTLAVSVSCLLIGYASGSHASTPSELIGTDLMADGFTIIDRDGLTVERFGGTDYWTTEPKTE